MHERVANTPEKVEAFVNCFAENPVASLIANLVTRVEQVEIAGRAYPLTINERGQDGNCYICNPVSAYIDYAIDETRNFASWPLLRTGVSGLIHSCAPLIRASHLDHVVHVNNWLFSTNPVPRITPDVADALRDEMVARFPDRAIVVRSLNTIADGETINALKQAGFRMLPARQIYIFDDLAEVSAYTTDMKRDRKALNQTSFRRVDNDDFSDSDYERSARLYEMLYVDKYTPLNPQYTGRYIREMHQRDLMRLEGLRDKSGDLVAVTGLFENGKTLTQPIVGYDTDLPKKEGLYRMIMAMAQDHALREGLFFNMSAGAADFKRRRRAVPSIEYSAVFVAHLPAPRRAAVGIMERLLSRIGIPLLQRYEL